MSPHRSLGYALIGAGLVLVGVIVYRNALTSPGPLLFAPEELLASTWTNYKAAYVDPQTFRTIDTSRDSITTSEGQSYTMLRAVWQGDKTTFDGAWQWTRTHLARPDDRLFAWLWNPSVGSAGGIDTAQSGENTASDADSDIALALLFAYARWQDPSYLAAAHAIVADIWDKEVVTIRGVPYLAADDVEKTSSSPWIVVNPSYLSPASYHLFAELDPAHPWEALRSASYDFLAKSADATLGASASAHLPPDWVRVSRSDGSLVAVTSAGYDINFGFDAMRVPFRIGLDAAWFGNPRATALLADFSFLHYSWQAAGALASIYGHDGSLVLPDESPSIYGGTLGYFMYAYPDEADQVYRKKLLALYDPGTASWKSPLSYYDDNWAWFGVALYDHLLPNLAADLPARAFSQ